MIWIVEAMVFAYPQIPVLLIATVTSPGFRLSPFSTSSCEGTASATHKSCAGFVYTPIFAFEGFTVVVVVADILYLAQQGASQSMEYLVGEESAKCTQGVECVSSREKLHLTSRNKHCVYLQAPRFHAILGHPVNNATTVFDNPTAICATLKFSANG